MAWFQLEESASPPGGLTFQSHLQQYASYTQVPPRLRLATVIGDFTAMLCTSMMNDRCNA
jgi:hypothetical protein